MVFVMIHCMEKVTDYYFFEMVMFFLSVSINPFTTIETTFAGSDGTIISLYYSHKVPTNEKKYYLLMGGKQQSVQCINIKT